MKSSNDVLGIKRSVDLNMNSSLQKDEENKGNELGTKSRRSSKTSKNDNNGNSKNGEKAENGLTFTSEDDVYYQPGG